LHQRFCSQIVESILPNVSIRCLPRNRRSHPAVRIAQLSACSRKKHLALISLKCLHPVMQLTINMLAWLSEYRISRAACRFREKARYLRI
jgi:hypothetical protein